MKRWKSFNKKLDINNLDDLLEFYDPVTRQFEPPKHWLNGRKPVVGLLCDDIQSTPLIGSKNFKNLCIKCRHVGSDPRRHPRGPGWPARGQRRSRRRPLRSLLRSQPSWLKPRHARARLLVRSRGRRRKKKAGDKKTSPGMPGVFAKFRKATRRSTEFSDFPEISFANSDMGKLNPETGIHFLSENLLLI